MQLMVKKILNVCFFFCLLICFISCQKLWSRQYLLKDKLTFTIPPNYIMLKTQKEHDVAFAYQNQSPNEDSELGRISIDVLRQSFDEIVTQMKNTHQPINASGDWSNFKNKGKWLIAERDKIMILIYVIETNLKKIIAVKSICPTKDGQKYQDILLQVSKSFKDF